MLDPRHDLCFELEAPDEIGLGGQFFADLFDRDQPVDRWLNGLPDDGERPGAHPFDEPISAQGCDVTFVVE